MLPHMLTTCCTTLSKSLLGKDMGIETDFSNRIRALFSFHLFTGQQNWVEEEEKGGRG